MKITRYSEIYNLEEAIEKDEPLLAVISFDGTEAVMSCVDESVEHYILLQKVGISGTQIDKYFRIVFDRESADWTFVCPSDYKNISDKQRRVAEFYKDGFAHISSFLSEIGYFADINIPHRYRRHFKIMSGDE